MYQLVQASKALAEKTKDKGVCGRSNRRKRRKNTNVSIPKKNQANMLFTIAPGRGKDSKRKEEETRSDARPHFQASRLLINGRKKKRLLL
jgi:hypothetical protein